jgi:hypothetical protein
MDETVRRINLQAFVDHLSETVTVGASSERIVRLYFFSATSLIECSPDCNWPETRRQAQWILARYHGQVGSIRALAAKRIGPHTRDTVGITMEDGELFQDCCLREASGERTAFTVFGSVQPGPCPCTTVDLENAITAANLALVQEIVKSGIDVNANGVSGPALDTALTRAHVSMGSKRAEDAIGVMNWLAALPGIRWDDLFMNFDGETTTVALEALGVSSQILRLLPWHTIDTHSTIKGGNNLLCSYLIETKHNPMFMLPRVRLLLDHGSGTLTLSVNDAGARACDLVASDLSVGILLRQVEWETAEAVRALLLQYIGVRALLAIVFGYFTTFP